jgi:hypothetical protein
MKVAIKIILIYFCLVFITVSCQKGINSSLMKVGLTDAGPSPQDSGYSHVYIDIKQISIGYTGAQNDVWMDLPTNAGIYDLLKLTNNLTTVISNEITVPIGRVGQIRLILGVNNSITIGGASFNLKVASGITSGVKILVDADIKRTQNLWIVLDFNVSKSIIQNGTGDFTLVPVIEVKSISNY